MFNLISYFEDRDIDYHLEGEKNVTRGWVNIQCPFPGCDDPSWHCGINLESSLFHCYICGNKGNLKTLIMELEGCSYSIAEKIIDEYSDNETVSIPKRKLFKRETENIQCILPRTEKIFHWRHRQYLKSRKFDPDCLIEKYKLLSMYNIGEYKFRIIIPYFYNRKLVCFNTRTIIENAEPRYLFSSIENSIIEVKHIFYNIDTIKDKCIIVEGPSDVWRMGDGCIAVSGKNFTKDQLLMLRHRNIKKALILYDADDRDERIGEKLANELSGMIPWIEHIELESGDPGNLSIEEVNKIRRIIF